MQHLTKLEKLRMAQIESFNELMHEHLESFPIAGKEAKILKNALKMSLRSNKDAKKIHYLNMRYAFAHHSNYRVVPTEIREFVIFLEANENIIDWNSVFMILEIAES